MSRDETGTLRFDSERGRDTTALDGVRRERVLVFETCEITVDLHVTGDSEDVRMIVGQVVRREDGRSGVSAVVGMGDQEARTDEVGEFAMCVLPPAPDVVHVLADGTLVRCEIPRATS